MEKKSLLIDDCPGPGVLTGNMEKNYLLLPDGNVIIANAVSSKKLYHQVNLVAGNDSNVILYGASGTGKEITARMIHHQSARADKPFVAINIGALCLELRPGVSFRSSGVSFRETIMDKKDHLELSKGGVLFLYGLDDLTPYAQAELFTILRERKLRIPGIPKEIEVDARFIAATSINLEEASGKGNFSNELFGLLNGFSIHLPSLYDRKEDILPYAKYYLEKIKIETGNHIEGFDEDVIELFQKYEWPGNLRELRNTIRRAALMIGKGKINIDALPAEILESIVAAGYNFRPLQTGTHEGTAPETFRLKRTKAEVEYFAIVDVLKRVNQNKTKAAEILKVNRKTLYNKIKMYNHYR